MRTVSQLNIFRVLWCCGGIVRSVNGSAAGADGDVALKTEVWTFGLSDDTTITKTVVLK